MIRQKDIREKTEAIIEELDFDYSSFTIQRFVTFIEDYIGRKIELIPWTMPKKIFGAWISDQDLSTEFIFFDENAPPMHRIHILLHELGHLIRDHKTLHLDIAHIGGLIAKGEGSEDLITSALMRSDQTNTEEVEAELFAILTQQLILQHIEMEQMAAATHVSNEAYMKALGFM